MLLQELSSLGSVLQIEVGRCPNPIIQFVAGADFAQFAIHYLARQWHVRAFSVVMKRNPLDAVGAEQSELADVLLELFDVPAIVGVGCFPVAELMTANRLCGSGRNVQV